MLYQVRFRQRQLNCCPPKEYWVVRSETVEAESAEAAGLAVQHAWRYNHAIEIKTIKEINDEQEKGK